MTISLALTPGEPAGVGPDLLITLAQQKHQQQLIAYADPDMLMQRAHPLHQPSGCHPRQSCRHRPAAL